MPALTDFQLKVTRLFFSLPASKGFLLAGGVALLAQHLTTRPTEDLDFFTAPGPRPRPRGTQRTGSRSMGTGLGHRAHPRQRHILPARHPERHSRSGHRSRRGYATGLPCLFHRRRAHAGSRGTRRAQAARAIRPGRGTGDFADVRLLARRFGKDVLLARAAQIDAGFDTGTLAGMIATLDRFADDEIPVPEGSSAAELRAFYAEWRSELMKLTEG